MSEDGINKRRRDRRLLKYKKNGKVFSILCTVFVHALLLLSFTIAVVKPIPPPDNELLIEFIPTESIPKEIQVRTGNEPKTENPTNTEDIRLVQKSHGTVVADNSTKNSSESEIGPDGDVEKYEPPQKPKIDKRALFSATKHNKDSLAEQTTDKVSNKLQAGNNKGNTSVGNTEGAPMARVKGREVMGVLPTPAYNVNNSGIVVVRITVNQYGTVTKATPGFTGTTVQDKQLWDAAKAAALKAKFNVDENAAPIQEGTITYSFILQ